VNLPAKVVTHGPLHQFQLAQVAVITDDVRKILILITRHPRGLEGHRAPVRQKMAPEVS